jgi:hypothetical protein
MLPASNVQDALRDIVDSTRTHSLAPLVWANRLLLFRS